MKQSAYTIGVIPHWLISQNSPLGHIYLTDESLREVLRELNTTKPIDLPDWVTLEESVYINKEPIGRIISGTFIFKNNIFYANICVEKEIPNLLDRIFCFLPVPRTTTSEYPIICQTGDRLETDNVSMRGPILVCDQFYRSDVKLLSLINQVDANNNVSPMTFGTIASPDGPKLHRLYIDGSNWLLDTEMFVNGLDQNPNATGFWTP